MNLRILAAALCLGACATPTPTESLVGTWAQAEANCMPIREMVFREDGSFLLTWTPFESYWDYGGRWTHDPRTGRLDIEVTGRQNYLPPDADLSGRVRIDGDTLTVDDMFFGSPRRGPACPSVFTRVVRR